MKEKIRVIHGNETMLMDPKTGMLTRPEIGMNEPSGEWRITGAIRLNNCGHTVERISLKDIVNGDIVNWQHKNGKQKWHVCDYDHGTNRIWMCPDHSIIIPGGN
jgi:hypothetical protein